MTDSALLAGLGAGELAQLRALPEPVKQPARAWVRQSAPWAGAPIGDAAHWGAVDCLRATSLARCSTPACLTMQEFV